MKGIFLIHGFLSEMNEYDSIRFELAKRYDIISSPTLPGHGKEGECDYRLFNKDDTFKLLLEEFDELERKCEIVDVMGFSMGGALATYLSQVRKINKLILIAPANYYFNPKALITNTLYAYHIFKKIGKSIEKHPSMTTSPYNDLKDAFLGDFHASKSFLVRKFIKTYIWKAYNEFRKIIQTCNSNLVSINNDTLILWGKLDQLVPKKSVEEIYKKCNQEKTKLKIYEEFTHLMLLSSNPEKIKIDILEFLDK